MIAVHSPHHIAHNPPKEFISNHVVAYGESPIRAELIFESLMDNPQVKLVRAKEFPHEHFSRVHASDYLDYLRTAYDEWIAEGLWSEGIMPEFFALGRMRNQPPPESALGKAGYYMTDSCTMIVKGTWDAIRYSGYTALTAAQHILKGEKYVFSLCRPPGHHAGYDYAGGYCFVNNAALAAKFLQDQGDLNGEGNVKAGILDLDFHHGNGTQDIIQRLENILLVSIHGDPKHCYPYLTGYTKENTSKNINFPLPAGIDNKTYFEVFSNAIGLLKTFGAEYLIISLGVDTFEKDELGNFILTSDIYGKMADYIIAEWNIPVLIVMEGGYNTDYLAANVNSFLEPFINHLSN